MAQRQQMALEQRNNNTATNWGEIRRKTLKNRKKTQNNIIKGIRTAAQQSTLNKNKHEVEGMRLKMDALSSEIRKVMADSLQNRTLSSRDREGCPDGDNQKKKFFFLKRSSN